MPSLLPPLFCEMVINQSGAASYQKQSSYHNVKPVESTAGSQGEDLHATTASEPCQTSRAHQGLVDVVRKTPQSPTARWLTVDHSRQRVMHGCRSDTTGGLKRRCQCPSLAAPLKQPVTVSSPQPLGDDMLFGVHFLSPALMHADVPNRKSTFRPVDL